MAPPLVSPHTLSALLPEPHTIIRVSNLSTTLPVSTDAWGRPGIPQPVLLSAALSLRHPFTTASESDEVTGSTVHYGTLSKALLKACKEFEGRGEGGSVRELVEWLFESLTGCGVKGVKEGGDQVLEVEKMFSLELEVFLPKASLLGDGVSVKGMWVFGEETERVMAYSMVLGLRELRIPAVVGVNANERRAKQVVCVGVEVACWEGGREGDGYCEMEEVVVKTVEESSFATLEALSSHLASHVLTYIIIPSLSLSSSLPSSTSNQPQVTYPRLKISLSKPTAVMFAAAPTVEVVVDSDPEKSVWVKGVWDKIGAVVEKRVPFPLEGRLNEWIGKGKGSKV